ncbi:MAG: AbgT family transporter [Xanthomonadales bacterium]|nr:AbgT family transporter [Gammaproteobacteria bacterium]MBT8055227.1 AbgT family transporter [Gammaproteobacteria bacterium]NND56943.1 AbgT family transporter [Xanthomonadales bacterium]NNK51901.1 AbgT family transporter [Xanthomonadales bacterium]
MTDTVAGETRGWFRRFLDTVEWLGNLLPHPVTLFAILCLLVVLVSGLAGAVGLSVPDVRPTADEGARIAAVSLLNAEGLRMVVSNLVTNFTNFVPLGTVLVAMLGVGVADRSGLLSALVRTLVMRAPRHLVTVAVVFAGVLSNTASEMGYVVLVPLAGVIFYSLGRHPLAGMAAAFAGVSGGYSANLLIGTVDPLLAGITEAAARLIDPEYEVHAAVNWYFMIISTFLITIVGSLVSTFIVEPKLGKYDPEMAQEGALSEAKLEPLNPTERKALLWAGISALVIALLVASTVVPESGMLRNPETGDILRSPFLRGIVAIIFVFFLVPGVVYGKVTGTINSDRDLIKAMADTMGTLGLYIVLVFFAAQFVAFFGWTNLGAIVAVTGAQTLQAIGLTGPLVFVPFIMMCSFINLMLGSASAQWAVTAPIFVPMLMLTGYSPEVIQAAYRIGDSTTNIITPMMSYFGLILAFATRYNRNLGIGTLIATMLPYSICFWLCWVALFFLWVFGLGMPVGPATATYYPSG